MSAQKRLARLLPVYAATIIVVVSAVVATIRLFRLLRFVAIWAGATDIAAGMIATVGVFCAVVGFVFAGAQLIVGDDAKR